MSWIEDGGGGVGVEGGEGEMGGRERDVRFVTRDGSACTGFVLEAGQAGQTEAKTHCSSLLPKRPKVVTVVQCFGADKVLNRVG